MQVARLEYALPQSLSSSNPHPSFAGESYQPGGCLGTFHGSTSCAIEASAKTKIVRERCCTGRLHPLRGTSQSCPHREQLLPDTSSATLAPTPKCMRGLHAHSARGTRRSCALCCNCPWHKLLLRSEFPLTWVRAATCTQRHTACCGLRVTQGCPGTRMSRAAEWSRDAAELQLCTPSLCNDPHDTSPAVARAPAVLAALQAFNLGLCVPQLPLNYVAKYNLTDPRQSIDRLASTTCA